jgi:polysaccharide pyruvyl transferase WcaK-like protein
MTAKTMPTHYFRLQYRRLRRLFGYEKAIRHRPTGVIKIIILGGFGYGNTGDEAQLGANLQLWKKIFPHADVTVLSPNPAYTLAQHGVHSEYASRVIFFNANAEPHHFKASDAVFKRRFWFVWLRMLLNVHLMRAGFSPVFASAEEADLLLTLHRADIVHVSGGGFLTGMTRSRLWDTSLVMFICQRLGTPYFLTGQTIGMFQSNADRWLARKALAKASSISLRDAYHSSTALIELGIEKERLVCSVDDALFCAKSTPEATRKILSNSGLDTNKPYICVNYHYREMSDDTKQASTERLAMLLDQLVENTAVQILLVPMHLVDEAAEQAVINTMKQPAHLMQYPYDYRIARGAIAEAECLVSFKHHPLIFALGEGVPCMSISLDEYYWHKNDGAMQNLGQQAFCVHGEQFYDESTVNLLNTFYANRASIKSGLRSMIGNVEQAYIKNRTEAFTSIYPHID